MPYIISIQGHRTILMLLLKLILKLYMLLLKLSLKLYMLLLLHQIPIIKHIVPNDGVSIIPPVTEVNSTSRHQMGLQSLFVPIMSQYGRHSIRIRYPVVQISLMWYQATKMMLQPRECTVGPLLLQRTAGHHRGIPLIRGTEVVHLRQAGMDTTPPVVVLQRNTMPLAGMMVLHLVHQLHRATVVVVIQASIPHW